MPQLPAGGGAIAPPPQPPLLLLMMVKDISFSARVTARRSSMLSKGGFDGLTSNCRGMFHDTTWQTAFGACSLSCFIKGSDRMPCAKRSKLPAAKERIAVDSFA